MTTHDLTSGNNPTLTETYFSGVFINGEWSWDGPNPLRHAAAGHLPWPIRISFDQLAGCLVPGFRSDQQGRIWVDCGASFCVQAREGATISGRLYTNDPVDVIASGPFNLRRFKAVTGCLSV